MAFQDQATEDSVFDATTPGFSPFANGLRLSINGDASSFDVFRHGSNPSAPYQRRDSTLSTPGDYWNHSVPELPPFQAVEKRASTSSCPANESPRPVKPPNVHWPFSFKDTLVNSSWRDTEVQAASAIGGPIGPSARRPIAGHSADPTHGPPHRYAAVTAAASATAAITAAAPQIGAIDKSDPNWLDKLDVQFAAFKLKPQPLANARKQRVQRKRCGFCRKNGESEEIYTSHSLTDAFGNCSCPVLRLYQCPICKEGDPDKAHTVSYCPKQRDNARHQEPGVGADARSQPRGLRNGRPNALPARSIRK